MCVCGGGGGWGLQCIGKLKVGEAVQRVGALGLLVALIVGHNGIKTYIML